MKILQVENKQKYGKSVVVFFLYFKDIQTLTNQLDKKMASSRK